MISGPLGTISGVYECAIQKLCENAGIKPKIVAATATIRNADNQILQLYGKEKRQFPPQGISIDDSYFAVISERNERPAREYVGIMPSGVSKTVAFTRVMASLLFATRYLMDAGYSDEVIDLENEIHYVTVCQKCRQMRKHLDVGESESEIGYYADWTLDKRYY